MKLEYFNVHINDDLWPQVATGHRIVEAEIGYKWVRVREALAWATNRKRVRRSVWDALKTEARDKPKHLRRKRK
tara:strand:+ start:235 stop:456 length:222 start_codon:yes stop_codon:yes gene_type:complete